MPHDPSSRLSGLRRFALSFAVGSALKVRMMGEAATGSMAVLGVTGSISAYKAAALARLLVRMGLEVQPVLSRAACRFVAAETFAGITGMAPITRMFGHAGEVHVSLAKSAVVIVIAPATADVLARLAQGRADDVLTATALCSRAPLLLAPAMHPLMWDHPATQDNVRRLTERPWVQWVGPEHGEVASGDVGMGRLAEPEAIAAAVRRCLRGETPLAGRHVLVTAGPTVEDLDPVRVLSNRSSGKMGFALAEAAARQGARVTLVAGPVALQTPVGVHRVDVRSALEMQRAMDDVLGPELRGADAVLMCAAVADYRAATVSASKLKRSHAPMTITLTPNPDLIASIAKRRSGPRPVLIAFALETLPEAPLLAVAQDKLRAKGVDAIVANSAEVLEHDETCAHWVTEERAVPLGRTSKSEMADRVCERLAEALS